MAGRGHFVEGCGLQRRPGSAHWNGHGLCRRKISATAIGIWFLDVLQHLPISADRKAGVPRTNPVDLIVADICGKRWVKKSEVLEATSEGLIGATTMEEIAKPNVHGMKKINHSNELMIMKVWNVLEPDPIRQML